LEVDTDEERQRPGAARLSVPARVSFVAEPLPPLRIARGREPALHAITEWNRYDHGYAGVHCARGRTYDRQGNLIAARKCRASGRFDGDGAGAEPSDGGLVEQKTKTARVGRRLIARHAHSSRALGRSSGSGSQGRAMDEETNCDSSSTSQGSCST
jgi:hypothetical protein